MKAIILSSQEKIIYEIKYIYAEVPVLNEFSHHLYLRVSYTRKFYSLIKIHSLPLFMQDLYQLFTYQIFITNFVNSILYLLSNTINIS